MANSDTVWELKNDGIGRFAVLVFSNDVELQLGLFELDGKPKHWAVQPGVEYFVDKAGSAKPTADISYLEPGAVVLNAKAHQALKDFFLQFGQLLELGCQGEALYFYNVTTLIACIDVDASKKQGNSIINESFRMDAIPQAPRIFKDPHTAHRRIYVNGAAKQRLEKTIADEQLVGMCFVAVGK
jgi:hypothetical protein